MKRKNTLHKLLIAAVRANTMRVARLRANLLRFQKIRLCLKGFLLMFSFLLLSVEFDFYIAQCFFLLPAQRLYDGFN